MSASDEWTEWHLTQGGWISGSNQVDFSAAKIVPPPQDRVLTCQYFERLSSGAGRMSAGVKDVWRSDDADLVTSLLELHGACPRSL
jgi:hypothetical protein